MRNSRERIQTLERFIKKKSDFENIINILNSIKTAAYNEKPIDGKILIKTEVKKWILKKRK